MKAFAIFLLWGLVGAVPYATAGDGGEFLIQGIGQGKVTVTMQGPGFGWDKNAVPPHMTYLPEFSDERTAQSIILAWDSPQAQDNGLPKMPWGLVRVSVVDGANTERIAFFMDFRDMN